MNVSASTMRFNTRSRIPTVLAGLLFLANTSFVPIVHLFVHARAVAPSDPTTGRWTRSPVQRRHISPPCTHPGHRNHWHRYNDLLCMICHGYSRTPLHCRPSSTPGAAERILTTPPPSTRFAPSHLAASTDPRAPPVRLG